MQVRKRIKVKKKIKPGRMKYKNEYYKIIELDEFMIIDGYIVETLFDKIHEVKLLGNHPNADPRTRELCLPENLQNLPLNETTKKMIENVIYTFNLDACYFTPWHEIKEYAKIT
jgi:actin-related protein